MPDLTVEEMLQGVSMVRNRAVARVFKELGLIEQWGTGIPQAIQRLADAGLPAPEFKEFGASLRVIVHIKDHSVTPHVTTDAARDVATDVVREVGSGLTGSEQQVVAILRVAGSLPARELASQTGLSDRQVQRILARLADDGIITREGSTRYGRWVVLK